VITLHQFPPAYGLSSSSPFCTKVETYLRLTGVSFRVVDGNLRLAPKGKLPYIDDEGLIVADSGFIIEHVKQAHHRDLDADLDAPGRAMGHFLRRTVEEHLYWALIYARWIDDAGWVEQRKVLNRFVPAPARSWLPPLLRRGLRKSLRAQGIGRHSPAEIYTLGITDVDAIAAHLQGRDFLLGESPTSFDASVHAMCWHALKTPTDNPITRAVQRHPALVAYVDRVNTLAGYSA
jgi:glutathione S-transferase